MSADAVKLQVATRPFYSAAAFSSQDTGWRTPRPLFLALCRYESGLPPDAPEASVPMPWVDPAASKEFALVPHRFTPWEDGLVQSWRPPPGAPNFVVVNPPYGNREEACSPVCQKKTCAKRGFCLEDRVPGIGEWVAKPRAEALTWAMRTVNILPHRGGASWFADILRPGPEAGAWEGGLALPGDLAPFHPYWPTSTWAVYRWRFLEVEVTALRGRVPFDPSDGSTAKNSAGFDSVVVTFRGKSRPGPSLTR